jgi:hypothetical protein
VLIDTEGKWAGRYRDVVEVDIVLRILFVSFNILKSMSEKYRSN